MRALLVVEPGMPVDSQGADALAVGPDGLDAAAATASARNCRVPLYLRVRGPGEPGLDDALARLLPATPAALLLASAEHGRDVAALGAWLAVYEARAGLVDRSTRILALIDTPRGTLDLASFVDASPRLAGLGWDAAPLAAALGAGRGLDAEGAWIPPLAHARSAVRLAAAATRVEAVEAFYPGDDGTGFRRAVAAARRDGFSTMLVREPWQVPPIRG